MNPGNYKSLQTIDTYEVFLDYINSLSIPVIDYIAIGVQDTITNTSASMMSRPEWQKAFCELNLAEHDPIRKASFNSSSKMFAFDEVDCKDSHGKEVMKQRKLFGIENGLILMERNLGFNFMLTLGTGYKNFNSYKYFVDNHLAIHIVFKDLINLLSPITKEYHNNLSNI
jgi:hypothetical protein